MTKDTSLRTQAFLVPFEALQQAWMRGSQGQQGPGAVLQASGLLARATQGV